jgi:hypothetical protein
MDFSPAVISAFVSSVILGLGGVIGKIWVNRVREFDKSIYQNELNMLNSKLDFALHTSKSIFEKQFNSCDETWKALLKLLTEIRYLERDFDIDDESFMKQRNACYEQHKNTHDILFNTAPYLSSQLRDYFFEATSFLEKNYQIIPDDNISDEFRSTYLEFYKENFEKAKKIVLLIEDLIRREYTYKFTKE